MRQNNDELEDLSDLLKALEETDDHVGDHITLPPLSASASSADLTVEQLDGFAAAADGVDGIQQEEDEEKGGDRELTTVQDQSRKRNRTAAMHNLNERTKREKISGKMKELQQLVPYSDKRDRASMLDTAITYMKSLQQQVQSLSESSTCGRCQCQIPVFPQPSSFQYQETPTYTPDQIMNLNMNTTTPFMSSSAAAGGGASIPPRSGVTRWFPRYGSTFVLSNVHPSLMPTTMPFFVPRGLAFPAESSDQTSSQIKRSSSEDCHFIPVPRKEEKIDDKKDQFS